MLRITFINVGYGDSIMVEELEGSEKVFTMLVDAGPPFEGEHHGDYGAKSDRIPPIAYLKEHGIEKLDIIFLTHFHIDHIGGIPAVMRGIPFGEVWANYRLPSTLPSLAITLGSMCRPESATMRRSLELLDEMGRLARSKGKDIKPVFQHRFGENLTAALSTDVYAVNSSLAANMDRQVKRAYSNIAGETEPALFALDQTQNASCAALRLSYKGRSALLAADLPHGYWSPLIDEGHSLRADILKFPHHGQADGASPKFAAAVAPSHVVFCVSEDNPFDCPRPSAFSPFGKNVHFHATESISMPPMLTPTPPHRAVVFEIHDDGNLDWRIEAT